MARCCASWPAILLAIANFVMIPLLLVQTLIIRFSQGSITRQAPYNNYYLTHYYPGGTTATDESVFDKCDYDGNTFFGRNCPTTNFRGAYSASAGALAAGILAFFCQFAVFVTSTVYSGGCCSKKVGRGLLIAGFVLYSVSAVLQLIEVLASLGIKPDMEQWSGAPLEHDAGFGFNIATLVLTVILLILTIIYFKLGGRDKIYCCSDKTSKTTVTVIAQTPAPATTTTTVQTTETIVQPAQSPPPVHYQPQAAYPPPTGTYPPDAYQQPYNPQMAPPQQYYAAPPPQYYQPQQQPMPQQQYYQPQQQQPMMQ